MDNKIALITGSTDGIGKQTALELAEMGTGYLCQPAVFDLDIDAAVHIRLPAHGVTVPSDVTLRPQFAE